MADMSTNPYARFVEGRDPLRSMGDTPRRIETMMQPWSTERFEQSYAAGKWTARQILLHLAQIEMVFATRVRFTLASEDYAIQPFEQDDWMRLESAPPARDALAAYVGLRRTHLALCGSLSPDQRAKTARHPEFGVITVDWMMAWLAGHELNHLPQLETIARVD